jgi:hypothetical protein
VVGVQQVSHVRAAVLSITRDGPSFQDNRYNYVVGYIQICECYAKNPASSVIYTWQDVIQNEFPSGALGVCIDQDTVSKVPAVT